jgi:hypothetical protein
MVMFAPTTANTQLRKATTRLAVPATTDYWVNDRKGDPLFVVTAEANAAMTRMLAPILDEVHGLLGPRRMRPSSSIVAGAFMCGDLPE